MKKKTPLKSGKTTFVEKTEYFKQVQKKTLKNNRNIK